MGLFEFSFFSCLSFLFSSSLSLRDSLIQTKMLSQKLFNPKQSTVVQVDDPILIKSTEMSTVKILCIGTDRPQQTVQTKIRLLLKKQSDQGLRCLPLHQLLLDALMQCYIKLYQL